MAIKGISNKVRQIAVRNIGRDEPTLLLTNALTTPAKDLFARYAERMTIENELDAYISGFHLDALTSSLPLNVDLDTTLTVVASNPCPGCSHSSCPATKTPPPTGSGGTSSTPPAPCTSPTTPSPST